MIRLLQLSDIHHQHTDDEDNDDHQIHSTLIEDLKEDHKNGQQIDGILICGDIADTSESKQYTRAKSFINDLCTAVGCEPHNVYTVPGNHDKDWGCNHRYTRTLIFNELRGDNGDAYFNALKDTEYKALDILYSPLKAYYEFASNYACCDDVACSYLVEDMQQKSEANPDEKVYWCNDLFESGNGFTLKLWGLNSVLTSCHEDNIKPLFLPKRAYNITKKRSDVNIMMMHHPISEANIINYKSIRQIVDERFQIQLYGHEHIQSSEAKQNVVKIYSGALNPHGDYDSKYFPSYNIIEIDLNEDNETQCTVVINVISYKWHNDSFYNNDQETKSYSIKTNKSRVGSSLSSTIATSSDQNIKINMKELQYKFMTRQDRKSIINIVKPSLYDDDYSEQINSINFLKYIISDNEKQIELWNLINK